MDKLNELSETQQQVMNNCIKIKEATNTLSNIYLCCMETTIKALFLLNAGGTVTVLAYMHQVMHIKQKTCLFSISLVSFLAGLIFTFILVAYNFGSLYKRLKEFIDDIMNYRSNKIQFNEIKLFNLSEINSYKTKSLIAICIGAIAGLLGIIGIATGI